MKIRLTIIYLLFLSACTIEEQVMELKTLRDCKFAVSKIERIDISGLDVNEIIQDDGINLFNTPNLALGFLEGSIPLQANLVIEITNPTDNIAAINQFDYKLLINRHEVVEGTIDQKISIAARDSSLVPLELSFDIYKFLANDSLRNDIQSFFLTSGGRENKEVQLTIRVKPGILIGGQLLKYPGFIDVEKTVDKDLIASYYSSL